MIESIEMTERPNRDARWWMGCQPHIRALREKIQSATANSDRDVENLLQKCVSLYMATIHHNSSMEDEKIYIALSGMRSISVPFSNLKVQKDDQCVDVFMFRAVQYLRL